MVVTILQRFGLGALAFLACAAPAGAAEVARIDGAHLDARDDRRAGLCLELRTGDELTGGGSSTCGRAPWRQRRSTLIVWISGADLFAAGAVPASVTRAEAEFVDGRRVAFDTVAGPSYRGRHAGKLRFFLAELPLADPGEGDAGGLLGEPPGGLPCVPESGAFGVSTFLGAFDGGEVRPPAHDDQVAAEAGGHRLLVRDAEADRLCAGVDRLLADGSDCALPAVNGEDAFGFGAAGMLYAVLPAEVARVRLPGGREVATIEGGYRGRYAGRLRFLFVEATVPSPGWLAMLDAGGAAIGRLPVSDPYADERPAAAARLASGRGWRLSAERYADYSCLLLAVGGGEPVCGAAPGGLGDGAFVAVGCSPRVAVMTGTLRRRTRAVRAVLRGGRVLRARVLRIPRRLGGGRSWVLALPRGARVTALRFDGRRATFPLLPARDQCGYRVYAPGLTEPDLG